MEFKLPTKNICTFILKHNLAFRADIQLKSTSEDISNGVCFPFLPNIIHTCNNEQCNLNGLLHNQAIDIKIKHQFPLETADSNDSTVSYIFFGNMNNITQESRNIVDGVLLVLGNGIYAQNIFETEDSTFDLSATKGWNSNMMGNSRPHLSSMLSLMCIKNNSVIQQCSWIYGISLKKQEGDQYYSSTYDKFNIDFLNGKYDIILPNIFSDSGTINTSGAFEPYPDMGVNPEYNMYIWSNNKFVTKENQSIVCIYDNLA